MSKSPQMGHFPIVVDYFFLLLKKKQAIISLQLMKEKGIWLNPNLLNFFLIYCLFFNLLYIPIAQLSKFKWRTYDSFLYWPRLWPSICSPNYRGSGMAAIPIRKKERKNERKYFLYFFNVGPPKEDIFLTTFLIQYYQSWDSTQSSASSSTMYQSAHIESRLYAVFKFEPGTYLVPSRYATNWAILAWIERKYTFLSTVLM